LELDVQVFVRLDQTHAIQFPGPIVDLPFPPLGLDLQSVAADVDAGPNLGRVAPIIPRLELGGQILPDDRVGQVGERLQGPGRRRRLSM